MKQNVVFSRRILYYHNYLPLVNIFLQLFQFFSNNFFSFPSFHFRHFVIHHFIKKGYRTNGTRNGERGI